MYIYIYMVSDHVCMYLFVHTYNYTYILQKIISVRMWQIFQYLWTACGKDVLVFVKNVYKGCCSMYEQPMEKMLQYIWKAWKRMFQYIWTAYGKDVAVRMQSVCTESLDVLENSTTEPNGKISALISCARGSVCIFPNKMPIQRHMSQYMWKAYVCKRIFRCACVGQTYLRTCEKSMYVKEYFAAHA